MATRQDLERVKKVTQLYCTAFPVQYGWICPKCKYPHLVHALSFQEEKELLAECERCKEKVIVRLS